MSNTISGPEAIIAASGRTVTDPNLHALHVRVRAVDQASAESRAPAVGTVIPVRDQRLLVLSRMVRWWEPCESSDGTVVLDGEPCHGWIAHVSGVFVAPTDLEAAEDAVGRRRSELREQLSAVIWEAADRERAGERVPAGVWSLPQVPVNDAGPDSDWGHRLYVDEKRNLLWHAEYGGDVMGYLGASPGTWQLWLMPYTKHRRDLVAAVWAEFGPDWWGMYGVSETAAAVLEAAGWSPVNPAVALEVFRLDNAVHATDLLACNPAQWKQLGWGGYLGISWLDRPRFTPEQVLRLGRAGVTPAQVADLIQAGHKTADAILAAAASK